MVSKEFHKLGTPLLIDQALLRSMDLGQIDLARIESLKVEVTEVKGEIWPSSKQYMRILRSIDWISKLLNKDVKLKVHFVKNNDGHEQARFLT